jgi:6,7-dimethyl-8-ribityllumazine synthase
MSKKIGIREISESTEIKDATIGIIVSRWNSMITETML